MFREMIEVADKVAIFGGDGCRDARDEVLQLAARLRAPVITDCPSWSVTPEGHIGRFDSVTWAGEDHTLAAALMIAPEYILRHPAALCIRSVPPRCDP